MITDTRGIVLRQVKTIGGRRMISLFTEQFGKIGAGVTISERGKGRQSAAMNPFTYGNYELFISHGRYHLNKGQVVKNFYRIGADVDRYMAAAYGLELCDKLLEEEVPAKDLFGLTVDFLTTMEERKSRYGTILLAYKVKLLACLAIALLFAQPAHADPAGDLDKSLLEILKSQNREGEEHGEESSRSVLFDL